MVYEQPASYNNNGTGQHPYGKNNGNVIYHHHSTTKATGSDHSIDQSALAQLDSDYDQSPSVGSFTKAYTAPSAASSKAHAKNVIKGILKNGKVASSPSVETIPVRQPKMGILKNRFYSSHVDSSIDEVQEDPCEIVELHDDQGTDINLSKETNANLHVSLDLSTITNNKSAKPHQTTLITSDGETSLVLQKSQTVSDSSETTVNMHLTSNGYPPQLATSRPFSRWAIFGAKPAAEPASVPGKAISKAVSPSASDAAPQQLSVNHLQVPSAGAPLPSILSVLKKPAPPSSSLGRLQFAPSTSNLSSPLSISQTQPAYYPGTIPQRVSDLRKILNPEVEKEDSFKKLSETIENCDCFEFNLNNAAKIITVLVLVATLIMVIKALKGDR